MCLDIKAEERIATGLHGLGNSHPRHVWQVEGNNQCVIMWEEHVTGICLPTGRLKLTGLNEWSVPLIVGI